VQRARFGATRVATGALAVAGTVVVFKVAMSVDPYLAAALVPALVVLMFALAAVLAPLFTMIGVRVVSLFTGRFGPTGYMAGMNSRSRTRRLASAVTPIVLAIGIAGMGLFQQSTSAAERSRQVRERIVAERVIAGGEVGLAPSIIDEVNTLDGVGPAIGIRHTEVFYGPDLDPSPAVGITAGNIADVLDLDVRSGSLGDLSAATTAISENMADQTDARLGTMLTVRLGDGYETTARVTAIYARSAGFADVILPQQLVAEHVTESNLDAVFVAVGTTATSDEPLQAIAARHPGAEVGDANIVQRGNDANETSQSWVGYLLMALVAAFAGIAVVNSLALSTAERTREFALMRLVGTTKRQVLRMLRWETLTVLLIGSTLGALVAVASLIPFSSTTTGRMMPSTPMLPCLALLGAAILLSLLGTQLPARLALRARPVDSIGIKQ
jgi:putative ABC transport system permease protein